MHWKMNIQAIPAIIIVSKFFFSKEFIFLLPRPKTLFLERYYFHRRVSVCLSVCVCVCVSEAIITQKVLDRFWWNLAGWRIMIKARFLLKMKLIALIERIPGPKEWRISIYLKIFSVESFEISLYNALYNSIDNL